MRNSIEKFCMQEQEKKERENEMFEIKDNRIYQEQDGKVVAEITFPETEPGIFTIDHTFVDPILRGQGIASKLVKTAVEEIKRKGGIVRATCPYAVKWLEEHPE